MSREPFRYEKLAIWQRGMALWERLQSATQSFPAHEVYGLRSQIRRAACSIPANIAEGNGKGTNPSFAVHVRHARGSVYELSTLIEGSRHFGYLDNAEAAEILAELDEISKMIDGFLRSLDHIKVREQMTVYGETASNSELPEKLVTLQLPTTNYQLLTTNY